jgi:hypothetical protein
VTPLRVRQFLQQQDADLECRFQLLEVALQPGKKAKYVDAALVRLGDNYFTVRTWKQTECQAAHCIERMQWLKNCTM